MGRLVRRYIRAFNITIRNSIILGTDALPIPQFIAGQKVVEAVIDATVLGGAVRAGRFVINATEDLTGVMIPLITTVTVEDGVTVTATLGAHQPAVYGAQIEVEVLGTGIVAGRTHGIQISMYSEVGTETQSAFQGINISNYNLGTQSADNYNMVDMRENGTYTINSMFYLRGSTGGINYFAILHGDTDAWHALGAPTTQSGWIRLYAGGLVRYIRLYSGAP